VHLAGDLELALARAHVHEPLAEVPVRDRLAARVIARDQRRERRVRAAAGEHAVLGQRLVDPDPAGVARARHAHLGVRFVGREERRDVGAERGGDVGERAQRRHGRAGLDLRQVARGEPGVGGELGQRHAPRLPQRA
jgi:hypothetical protein